MTTVEEKSSAALAEPLRGSWYIYYDYWFADQGILKVRVLSPAVYVSMLVGWLVFVEVLIKYVGGVSTYFRVLEFGGLMLLIAVSLVRVRRKRRKLSNLRLEDLLARSDAVLIP